MRDGRRRGGGTGPAVAEARPVDDGLAAALEEVGDRWTLHVVEVLLEGPRRFNEIQAEVPGIATNVLTKRLVQLEERGLAVASAYSARPPRYVYELTAAGHELGAVVMMLRRWGARRQGGPAPSAAGPEHAVCGTGLEQRWWCPTCDRPVPDHELGPVSII